MIRAVLFDMGNVLLHFCHDRMCEQMGVLCGQSGASVREHLFGEGLHLAFEEGRHTAEEFHLLFQERYPLPITLPELYRANSDIFSLNEPLTPILESLKAQGLRMVLLSNTNIWHFHWIRENYRVLDLFDDFSLSYEVGANKPAPIIYQDAIRRAGCSAEECFYTDDLPDNIEAGRQQGLNAELFTDAENLRQQLQKYDITV